MVKEAHIVFFFVYVLWRVEYPVNSHDYVIMFYFDREEKFENSYVWGWGWVVPYDYRTRMFSVLSVTGPFGLFKGSVSWGPGHNVGKSVNDINTKEGDTRMKIFPSSSFLLLFVTFATTRASEIRLEE